MEDETTNVFNVAHTENLITTVTTLPSWTDYSVTAGLHDHRTWFSRLEADVIKVADDIVISGNSLSERLDLIERLLNIPKRDLALEAKYPRLAEIYQEYMKEVEKLTTYEKLKGSDNE